MQQYVNPLIYQIFFRLGAVMACAFVWLSQTHASSFTPSSQPIHCDFEFAKLGRNADFTAKSKLVIAYLHKPFSTTAENLKWIRLAKKTKQKPGTVFGEAEFWKLQKVNTVTNDKNFATSLTNKHKELTFLMLESIKQKHQDRLDLIIYSDFKSVRYAFVPKSVSIEPDGLANAKLRKDLESGFQLVNNEFTHFIKSTNLEVSDAGPTAEWFRGGIGETADQANLAARTSRDMSGPNTLRDFDNPEIQRNLESYRQWSEQKRVELIGDTEMTSLHDGRFVKDEVLDIVKKSTETKVAQQRINAKFGTALSEIQVERIQIYNEIIDKFAPGIYVTERKVATLESADAGGLTADFAGIGAKNLGATARALADGKNLNDALQHARKNETLVTAEFQAATHSFNRIVQQYVEKTISSGDDFVGILKSSWTTKQKFDLITKVATLKNPSGQRIAFISDGVLESDRNILAAHGEAIEKILRQELEGRVHYEKLQQIVFGIDMHSKRVDEGQVGLITGEGRLAHLSANDRREIESAFQRAVTKFNFGASNQTTHRSYLAK